MQCDDSLLAIGTCGVCGVQMPVLRYWHHERGGQYGCGDRVRSVALVIWLLSRNINLAGYYVWTMHPDAFSDDANVPDDQILALLLLSWWKKASTQAWVRAAVDDPNHKTRVLADEFLMRSLVAEHIFRQNARNQAVPPSALITCYLRYWSYRPVPLAVQEKLVRLTYNKCDRTNFMRRLREEWHVRPGLLHPERCLTQAESHAAVGIVARTMFLFRAA